MLTHYLNELYDFQLTAMMCGVSIETVQRVNKMFKQLEETDASNEAQGSSPGTG